MTHMTGISEDAGHVGFQAVSATHPTHPLLKTLFNMQDLE